MPSILDRYKQQVRQSLESPEEQAARKKKQEMRIRRAKRKEQEEDDKFFRELKARVDRKYARSKDEFPPFHPKSSHGKSDGIAFGTRRKVFGRSRRTRRRRS